MSREEGSVVREANLTMFVQLKEFERTWMLFSCAVQATVIFDWSLVEHLVPFESGERQKLG